MVILAAAWSGPALAQAEAPDAGASSSDATVAEPDGGGYDHPSDSTYQPSSEEGPREEQAFLQVTLNATAAGDLLVILRERDVLMRIADLEAAGLHGFAGTREKREAGTFVSLRSLAPKVSYVFDEANLSLTIRADPSFFGTNVVDVRSNRPAGIIYDKAPGLFVNYSVSLNEMQRRDTLGWTGTSEAGLSVQGQLLYGSVTRLADGRWVRLMSNLTFDLRDSLTRVIVGDAVANSDALGGTLSLGGLSVTRSFALDPYFIVLPSRQLSGTLQTPSTVDVYVNGQLIRRQQLPPGQFDLQNVPLITGRGETRVVIRDAFGNERSVVSPYYLALGTLAKGLSDFSYNLGFQREGYGKTSWDYGDLAFLLRHRRGLTNWLTLGYRAEGTRDMVSGGPSLAVRLPFGELAILAAVSGANAQPADSSANALALPSSLLFPTTLDALPACAQGRPSGEAALVSYSYIGRAFSFQTGARYQSVCYVNLVQPINQPDRQRFDVTASTAGAVGRLATLSLQYQGADWRVRGWSNRFVFTASRALTRRLYGFLSTSAIFAQDASTTYETFGGLSLALGERTSASMTRTDDWQGSQHRGLNRAEIQRSLPIGQGYGYRLVAEAGQNELEQATVQYQGAHGRLQADYRRDDVSNEDRGHASLTGMGGLVIIDRDFFLTRSVQDSYALIRVPGVGGVHGTLSNQVVGTTNKNGNLLIPNMLPYYGNRVGIDDKDIPFEYNINATEMTIAPPYRGGAVVRFPVRKVQSVSGTVMVDEQGSPVVPAYGQITVRVTGSELNSPLDEAGNFFLENVPPGEYEAEVLYATGVCNFQMVVPVGATSLTNVGTLRCTVPRKESR
jgi:outer membrane usher protein